MKKLSDDLIMLTSKLMLAQEKSEVIKITSELNDCIARLLEAERTVAACSPTEKTATGFLKFTDEEVSKMPKTFRKEFRTNGCTAHVLKRKSGKNTYCYEIRYRRNGYNIDASSTNLAEAKRKFIEALQTAENKKETQNLGVPKAFDAFALYYIEHYRKKKYTENTIRSDLSRFKNHIQPYFKSMPIAQITPSHCQILIDTLDEKQLGKTANEVTSLLNCIFRYAIAHHLIRYNPMDTVLHVLHESETGTPLTPEEQAYMFSVFKGTKFEKAYALALYTGMRPNELYKVWFDDQFVYTQNSKQKNGKIEYKKIPILPELRPYLPIDPKDFLSQDYISNTFAKAMPGHSLKDLRATFSSRCIECKVDDFARKKFLGHKITKLEKSYAQPSDEYYLSEAKKIHFVPQNVPQKRE